VLKQPLIHLWIYNHPFYGISDQVEYFVAAFVQNGYEISVGRQPRKSALNVVIENFSAENKELLVEFCQTNNKNVAIILTEHLDFIDQQMYIHGDPFWTENDYMNPKTQVDRIGNLMECNPYVASYFVLGDLPELRGFSELLPGADVRSIPFPKVKFVPQTGTDMPDSTIDDLLFTGVMTNYRKDVFSLLKAEGFSATSPWRFVSRKRRDAMNRSVKLILNIPQRRNWRWLSLQRVIAGLRCGRATVSLGTHDASKISACTYQLDLTVEGRHLPAPDHIQGFGNLDLTHDLLSSYQGYNIIKFRNRFFGVAQYHGSLDLFKESDRSHAGTIVADDLETVIGVIKSRPSASLSVSMLSKILRRLKLEVLLRGINAGDPSNFESMYFGLKEDANNRQSYITKPLQDLSWEWPRILKEYLADRTVLYRHAYENYMTMVSEDERLEVFPHDIIEYWAITDRIMLDR
jgi:hypothetical protein